jgi:hypothetical protein
MFISFRLYTIILLGIIYCSNLKAQSSCDDANTFITLEVYRSKSPHRDHLIISDKKEYPKFNGGTKKLEKYLAENLEFTEDGATQYMMLQVCFFIDCSGDITIAEMLGDSKGYKLTNILEVVKNMPSWEPLKKDGKEANCWYVMKVGCKNGKVTLHM